MFNGRICREPAEAQTGLCGTVWGWPRLILAGRNRLGIAEAVICLGETGWDFLHLQLGWAAEIGVGGGWHWLHKPARFSKTLQVSGDRSKRSVCCPQAYCTVARLGGSGRFTADKSH